MSTYLELLSLFSSKLLRTEDFVFAAADKETIFSENS